MQTHTAESVPVRLHSLTYGETKTYLFAALFIAGNILLPQLCHLAPLGGVRWLPIYFFTLVGACKYGWRVGLLTALLSPLINSALFGMPAAAALPPIPGKIASAGRSGRICGRTLPQGLARGAGRSHTDLPGSRNALRMGVGRRSANGTAGFPNRSSGHAAAALRRLAGHQPPDPQVNDRQGEPLPQISAAAYGRPRRIRFRRRQEKAEMNGKKPEDSGDSERARKTGIPPRKKPEPRKEFRPIRLWRRTIRILIDRAIARSGYASQRRESSYRPR